MAVIKTYTKAYNFTAVVDFPTLEEAQHFAAEFPTSYKVTAKKYSGTSNLSSVSYALVEYPLDPRNDNCAGAKKAVRFMNKAEKLGYTLNHTFTR